MPKSALEKQLQKQAREEALRQQAVSIISAQKVVDGFRILDDTSETVLKILLDHCPDSNTGRVTFENAYFSPIVQKSLGLELEKLKQCGMLHVFIRWPNSGIVDLYQSAFQYFEKKEKIMLREALSTGTTIENHFHGNTNIIGADVNGSVIVAGDNNTVKSAEGNRLHQNGQQSTVESAQQHIDKKIFISHRSNDREIADMMFEFFIKTGIPREAIFCSSLPGNDVKEFISKEVRQAIQTSQVNIAILSRDYYESAYCVNEAGILWYLEDICTIPVATPEIHPDDMIGFLNKEYKIRRLDNTDDITYIYDTVTEILGIPQLKSSIINTESKKLINKYTDHLSKRSEPAPQKDNRESIRILDITVSKYEVKNSQSPENPLFEFEVILCNQSDKTISVYEKYLHFLKGDQELKRIEVSRFEVHRRKDDLDDLLVLEPVNRIITLAPGHAEDVGILGDYNEVKDADRVSFTCIANCQEYTIPVFGQEK